MTTTQLTKNQKIHGIIHTAATAAAGVGAGLAQLPGADAPVLTALQTTMIIAIAHEHGMVVSKTAAADVLLTFTATLIGRSVSHSQTAGVFPHLSSPQAARSWA